MADKLSMSLDEISAQKKPKPSNGNKTSGGGKGTKRKSSGTANSGTADGRRLYVGNLSFKTSWQDLKDHFKTVGNVTYAKTVKGWGIVEMETVEEAVKAIEELNDVELDGRPLNVREDREDKSLSNTNSKGSSSGGPNPKRSKVKVGKRLFVQNLAFRTSWQDLKDHFRQAGNVVHASIMKDGNRSKGCGIVEFETPAEARKAMNTLNESELGGRSILIREDREDRDIKGQSQSPLKKKNDRGEGTQLVIHGLPWSYTWQQLKDMVANEGVEVIRADIVQGPNGRSKGFGTVAVGSTRDANKVIKELDGAELEGRPLSVKFDKFS
mmetsp:Transcript_23139/g.28441  ORF Transcript_23139/g.28441 Transcript_23139/m.28441 type:complete len:325 (-) Transcript_23139:227-1201(-)|eukprot:CAMPEP_0204837932 /NCGR_PEP_ID=MMETSP1346-20131115/29334_1 /ASSEMBLY_ACC=CAM_ASM_000771 /TAXON_ID=215587 /ORGANISM="Aplanochytrium stocchinoi, Strain GSBS06" /LENGTH=324 /DNA_ID=CAMNT_0051973665 /DNA_START=44 /DNA_END=1018 /DNA_ORIENTATION=-